MDLPSKDNGLDIEGMVIFRRKIYSVLWSTHRARAGDEA
jgi:hypothetical protein